MRPSLLDRALAHIIAAPDSAATLLACLAVPPTACLDDDAIAALAELRCTPRELAHALTCPACADVIDALDDVAAVEPLPGRGVVPFLPSVALAASLREDGDSVEVLHCTGTTRVQGALAVRSGRGLAGISLRDRAEAPRLELALLASPRPRRWTLLVRWLVAHDGPLIIRASRDGRVLAEDGLRGDSAVLEDLRRGDLRVDIHGAAGTVATAWIEVAP